MGNSSVLALGNHPVGRDGKSIIYFFIMSVLQPPVMTLLNVGILFLLEMEKLVEGARQISVVTTNGAIGEILSTALFAADSELRKDLLAEFSSVLSQFFLIGY